METEISCAPLAIGDIHGCYRSLAALESFAEFKPEDWIITLGDYVDRGPDSKSVIEWLIDRNDSGNLIALRGNHELMMFAATRSERQLDEWRVCGGDTVLSSYGADAFDAIPGAHLAFLRLQLRSHFKTRTHFFVHANAYAEVPLDEQPDVMLYWESFGNPVSRESGLTMVCGHTPQRTGERRDVGHAICIDTWAGGRGWLTFLDVAARFRWQANEAGDTRSFWIDDGP
ncbi:metallophosphoesterase family protein [Allorhodopirellula heiligendammensis]|uniref:Serine/threonine-protein phosphatase 1 n=1 Tax=Allorhodopirellula heiligendammensis TaxID=2714739 RepID=A0A5C6C8Q4_9BACT|nr:metallophosphoesterase family protein [Allorhodopirellula heiligendammensis]TWU19734.1 Serine/threonine-protein phosphatase 1 [Allorhodopirellula heiligendammensis]